MKKKSLITYAAWGLGLVVTALAYIAWGQHYGYGLTPLDAYRIFPLFGLVAFSLMWTHYVIGTLRDLMKLDKEGTKQYFEVTGWAVLVLICLHPGLLIIQRFRDGYGLPPGSYESYVAHGLGWITLLGTASLLVFLAFEFRRWFEKRSWWHIIPELGDLAMLAIVYHSLRLGTELMSGWYRTVWWFYAVTLVVILGRSYYLKLAKPKTRP